MTEAADRTRTFFTEGRPLPDAVQGRLGLEFIALGPKLFHVVPYRDPAHPKSRRQRRTGRPA